MIELTWYEITRRYAERPDELVLLFGLEEVRLADRVLWLDRAQDLAVCRDPRAGMVAWKLIQDAAGARAVA